MPRITISYRRDDSGVITGRIFDRLAAHYGRDAVFRDIDNIPLGVDFRRHTGTALGASDVVLAIVGPHWTGLRETGNRLADEADPVRLEIEATLRQGVALIPVLVLGATMPATSELPDSLKDFAYRNAIQIDAGQDFDIHMSRLIRAMDEMLHLPPGKTAAPDGVPGVPPQRSRFQSGALRVAVTLAILLAIGVPSAEWYVHTRPPSALPASPLPVPDVVPSRPQPSTHGPPIPPPAALTPPPESAPAALTPPPEPAPAALTPPPEPAPAAARVQPSFDCAKARSIDEVVICGRPDLAAADAALGKLYRSLYDAASGAAAERLKIDEITWGQARNVACNTASSGAPTVDRAAVGDCLLRETNKRIAYLKDRSAPAAASANALVCGRLVNYGLSRSTTPPQYAPYLGVWTGVWNNPSRICGAVIVEQVSPDGVANVMYVYGPSSAGSPFPWRQQSLTARFAGTNQFSFQDDQGSRFVFSRAGYQMLEAVFSGESGNLRARFAKLN
jgi:uncharacterized protein YecT (DUF1311 family)